MDRLDLAVMLLDTYIKSLGGEDLLGTAKTTRYGNPRLRAGWAGWGFGDMTGASGLRFLRWQYLV